METIMSTLCHLKKEQAQLIKKRRYFSCKEKGYTGYNFSKKRKIAAILEGVSENSNS